ncbi:hypothetical protein [Oceanobacillus sp. MO10714A]|uniref:hypothetical protein n=1 Tax=Oceanobacillus sp. MO10714A TaxID=3098290 RepID=UPI00300DD113
MRPRRATARGGSPAACGKREVFGLRTSRSKLHTLTMNERNYDYTALIPLKLSNDFCRNESNKFVENARYIKVNVEIIEKYKNMQIL